MPKVGDTKPDGHPLCGRRVRVIQELPPTSWCWGIGLAPLREGQLGTIKMFCTSELNRDALGYVLEGGSWMLGIAWDGRQPCNGNFFCGLSDDASEASLRKLHIELLPEEQS